MVKEKGNKEFEKSTDAPLVSVIMSTYNETKKQIHNSINSILNQTFDDFEFIIVVDNPANKELLDTLDEYEDNRIRIIVNKENIGLSYSLNKAIKECRGTYIARMDADDIAEPERIEKEKKYLEDNNLDHVGSFVTLIDENETEIGKTVLPVVDGMIKSYLKCGSPMAHPTWFLKRSVYERVGLYRNIPYTEDFDFLLREKKYGIKFGNVPLFLLKYTVRQNGISKSNGDQQFYNLLILLNHYSSIEKFDEKEFEKYKKTKDYSIFMKSIQSYQKNVHIIRDKHSVVETMKSIIKLVFNKNLYLMLFRNTYKKAIIMMNNYGV